MRRLFQAACQIAPFSSKPFNPGIAGRALPIQYTRVKLPAVNNPGRRITVESRSVPRGRTVVTAKIRITTRNTGTRPRPSVERRWIEPRPPMVTKRLYSLSTHRSMAIMTTPTRIITAAITAATPGLPDLKAEYSAVGSSVYLTPWPRMYGVPKEPSTRVKIRSSAESSDGSISGRTIRRATTPRGAPRMRADSSSCTSSDRSALPKSRNANGKRWNASQMMIGTAP